MVRRFMKTLACAVCAMVLVGCGQAAVATDMPTKETVRVETVRVSNAKGRIYFRVAAGEGAGVAAVVRVSGRTSGGVAVDSEYEAQLGQPYYIECASGSYVVSVAAEGDADSDVIYKAVESPLEFDADQGAFVELTAEADPAALQALRDERAAAERVAAEQAEAEQAAKEQAAAEQAAKEQAEREAAEAAAAETQGKTVYLSQTGKKYHRYGCRTVKKGFTAISEADAVSQGYGPCGVCNP